METDLNSTVLSENDFAFSFLEVFKEYKHRVLLFRLFFSFSILCYALAAVFILIFSPFALGLIVFGYFFNHASKNQLVLAEKAEEFILVNSNG